uniref:Pentatricopeptide repeat-containing protein n=1 Tax=Daucus carota subsp. sativus TaxID=79200 RepID=A0A166GRC3_DAUCS
MNRKDLVSWTSMMIGYGKEAGTLFNEMVKSGIQLDQIVFVAVMGDCSHAGMVDGGMCNFKSMTVDYKLPPNQEVYGCVFDLLGRSGRVEEAFKLTESMPFKPDESVWGALLGASQGDWGDFARMRKLMRGTGNEKEATRSWVELRDQKLSSDEFVIEYQCLTNDDGTELFRAMANMKHIRPYSPETATIDYYSLLQEVDALCDDNWWWCSFQKYFKL